MCRRIFILVAAYAAAAHFFIGTHVELRELLLAEEYIETQSQDSESQDQCRSYDSGYHLIDKIRADGFVVVNLVYDTGEHGGDGDYLDLLVFFQLGVGDGVRYINFGQ